MTTQTPTENSRAASPKAAAPHRTTRLAPWQTLMARLGLPVLLPLAVLLGVGLGIIGILLVQRAHGVVATVNGVPIRDQDFYHRLEVAAGPQVLQQMVNEEMQVQFAAKEGVLPTDADVEAKLDQARSQPDFAKNLAATRQTEADVRRSILVSLAKADVLTKGVAVSDNDVQAFYNKNVDTRNPTSRYYTPEAVQVAVIVTPNQQAQNQALSDLAAGMSFAQAAQKYSTDPSAANGGLLKPLLLGRSAVSKNPKLQDLLFSMQVGQQRNGVKIGNNWWIIRCVGHNPAVTKPFDQVRDEARLGAMLEKGLPVNGQAMQQAYADFQRSSQIKPVWPQYKPADAGQ